VAAMLHYPYSPFLADGRFVRVVLVQRIVGLVHHAVASIIERLVKYWPLNCVAIDV
jgi:hypothetical protein